VRTFDAPREVVFQSCSDANQLALWWAPRRFEVTVAEADARSGGAWRVVYQASDGAQFEESGVFLEVVKPERLVLTHDFRDVRSGTVRETIVTIELRDLGDKTELHFHQAPFESTSKRDEHMVGWNECLDQLSELVVRRGVAK
jgi:uncharacterized protein YndB with AHSA1/START domain